MGSKISDVVLAVDETAELHVLDPGLGLQPLAQKAQTGGGCWQISSKKKMSAAVHSKYSMFLLPQSLYIFDHSLGEMSRGSQVPCYGGINSVRHKTVPINGRTWSNRQMSHRRKLRWRSLSPVPHRFYGRQAAIPGE